MSTLENRLQHPMFKNWVKSAMTLDIAREPLKEFVEFWNATSHRYITHQLPVPCQRCLFDRSWWCSDEMCRHNRLQTIITKTHVYRAPSFENSTPRDCWTQPWEFAKCFMPPKTTENILTPNDTDISGLISVLLNNWEIKSQAELPGLKTGIFGEVRKVRNEIMHNQTFEVDERTFNGYTFVIVAMLNRLPVTHTQIRSLARIDELCRGTLPISVQDTARLCNDAIRSLKQLETEIKDSITALTNFSTQTLKDNASDIDLKVKEGADTIGRKTTEGTDTIERNTTEGADTIESKSTEGADTIERKTAQGSDTIERKTTEGADTINRKTTEAADTIERKTTEGADTIERKTTEGADTIERKTAQGADTIDHETTEGADTIQRKTTEGADTIERKTAECADKIESKSTEGADTIKRKRMEGDLKLQDETGDRKDVIKKIKLQH